MYLNFLQVDAKNIASAISNEVRKLGFLNFFWFHRQITFITIEQITVHRCLLLLSLSPSVDMELSPTYVLSNSIAEEIHKERAVVIAIVDLVLEGVVCGVEPTTALPSLVVPEP